MIIYNTLYKQLTLPPPKHAAVALSAMREFRPVFVRRPVRSYLVFSIAINFNIYIIYSTINVFIVNYVYIWYVVLRVGFYLKKST